jgi:hypothetical protein
VRRSALVVCALVGGLLFVPAAAGDQAYSDPAGDATGGAPDLTAITVANDAAGTITFSAAAAGLPAPDTDINLIVDSDRNLSTGDPDGDEFWLYLDGASLESFGLRWNGSDWVAWSPPTGRASFENGTWTLSVNRSDLNGTASFDFYFIGAKYSGDSVVGRDDAPDGTALYTYTVTQTPGQPRPPSPSPRQRTYEDAPRLPSRIRYVGNSIKHVRIGEKLYATMRKLGAPRVVAVACWSKADWPSVVESAGIRQPSTLDGFWLPRQPRWVHVSPKQCADVQALLSSKAINGHRAYALATVLHERVHAQGVGREAQTECYAVQLVYGFARELNFVHAKALRLEQLAVRKSRAVAPRGYWDAARCRDGGAWDLYAEFRNLSY